MRTPIHILMTLLMLAMPVIAKAQFGFDVGSVEAYISDHKSQRSLLLARATLEQSNNLLHEYSAKAAEDYKVLNFDLDKYTRAFDVIDVLYQSLRTSMNVYSTYQTVSDRIGDYKKLLSDYNSKVLKRNFIETATRIMLDAPYSRPDKSAFDIDWIGVKASQFSFSRLHKADPVLGVDMSSTGEVGCIGDDFSEALLNSMIATGFKIPEKAVMFSSGAMKSKVDLLDASRMLFAKGYQIYATAGTAAFLNAHGVETTPVYWPDEKPGAENNVMKMIADHKFDLIVNIPKNHSKRELTNGYKIRRGAIDHNIPLITNARLASAFIEAFCEMKLEDIQIKSWQEYK